jgi:hypothetical protein
MLKFLLRENLILRRNFGNLCNIGRVKCYTILSGNSTLPHAKGIYIVPKHHCDKFICICQTEMTANILNPQ